MEVFKYAPSPPGETRSRRFTIVVGTLFAIAIIAIIVLALSMRQHAGSTPAAKEPTGLNPLTPAADVERFDSAAVFAERVQPVLSGLRQKNAEASGRAVARIRMHFDGAKSGAPGFAKSIIGPLDASKTTYLAAKGTFLRWWYEDPTIQPVAAHVTWNYEQHVTSGPKIRDAIIAAVTQLEQDLRANRNEALQAISSSLRATNLTPSIEIEPDQLSQFCQREFEAAIGQVNSNGVAENAALGSAASLATGTAVTFIVEQAITRLITGAITTAGGAVAGGTGGGAVVGSWVPGGGTVIGAAAGLLGGCAVEIWMTHRNEKRTVEQVIASLTQLEEAIVQGDKDRPGIQKILSDAATRQADQLGVKLKQQLQEAAR
jgi:hypothetical protein